jgi:hypothetical protein
MNAKAQIQKRGAVRAGQILSERLTFANGAFEQSNFHDYTYGPPTRRKSTWS